MSTALIVNIVSIAIIFIVLFAIYNLYVSVVRASIAVKEALSSIDVQLKKRYDLIPNILTIAKKFMEHEKGLMEEITNLRTNALNAKTGSSEKFALDGELNSKLAQLMVQVENYPQLKSDATMLQAMRTYNEVEEHIAASRRFYNSSITALKNIVMVFPGNLFAGFAGETLNYAYFETDEASKAPVNASQYL